MFEDKYIFESIILDDAQDFIDSLDEMGWSKTTSAIDTLRRGDFASVHTKTLKGKIREMIVKKFRIIFFIEGESIYFISGFRKKSNKTPLNEIEYAEKIYKIIKNSR